MGRHTLALFGNTGFSDTPSLMNLLMLTTGGFVNEVIDIDDIDELLIMKNI